jgi:hypothetical protein
LSPAAPGAGTRRRGGLGGLFEQLNQRFFRGRLPRYTVRLSTLGFAGAHGRCRPQARTILIARGLPADLARRTLLHEMCHIGSLGHGRRFQAKLARLAAQGERWAGRERVLYERISRQRAPLSAEVRYVLEALARQDPDLPWAAVRRFLLTRVTDDPRKMPQWAKALWHRLASAATTRRGVSPS